MDIKKGDKVIVHFSKDKHSPIKQGEVSEVIQFGGHDCIRLVGSNKPYAIDCAVKISEFCQHDPFDRDIDFNENQYCTICGTITKLAEDLYTDDDDLLPI